MQHQPAAMHVKSMQHKSCVVTSELGIWHDIDNSVVILTAKAHHATTHWVVKYAYTLLPPNAENTTRDKI